MTYLVEFLDFVVFYLWPAWLALFGLYLIGVLIVLATNGLRPYQGWGWWARSLINRYQFTELIPLVGIAVIVASLVLVLEAFTS